METGTIDYTRRFKCGQRVRIAFESGMHMTDYAAYVALCVDWFDALGLLSA